MIVCVAAVIFPAVALAQGGGEPPPPCCNLVVPPPAPPGATVSTDPVTGVLQVSISDATLQSLGMTRSEFLDRLGAGLFPDQQLNVLIPVILQTATMDPLVDGSTSLALVSDPDAVPTAPVLYFQIPRSGLDAAALDLLNLLYLTDGTTSLRVVFIRDVKATVE